MPHDLTELFVPDMSLVDRSQFTGLSKEEARQQIQVKIDDATKDLRALGPVQNELAPFHVLPDELLTEIFLYVKSEVERSPSIRGALRWMRPCWVCRRWRYVALRSQLLWTSVEASNMEVAEIFLQRSGTAPVNFRLSSMFQFVDMAKMLHSIDMITRHANHISYLHVEVYNSVIMKQFIDEIESIPFNNLLQLNLDVISADYSVHPSSDASHLFNFRSPHMEARLRVLKLCHISFDWNSFSGTHLRRLILQNDCRRQCTCPSTDVFVDVLNSCPQLEEIRLHWQGPTLGSHPTRAVKLNNLRQLAIHNEPLVIAYILAHIDFPASAKVQLVCQVDVHFIRYSSSPSTRK